VSVRVLLRGGPIYSPADPSATAVLFTDGRIEWLGPAGEAPAADRTVELDGALVTPAFVDAHVHTTSTGLMLRGLDVTGAPSRAALLDRVAAAAARLPRDGVVVGHGWDESGWPDRTPPSLAELDRAGGGRLVYLSRVDVHSAVVSSALLARASLGAAGYDAGGWLRTDAHHEVRAVALGSVSAQQRTEAQRAALRHAASMGIAAVHECGGPKISSEDDFTGLLALSAGERLPAVYGYWGELGAAAKARELGAAGAGGDLFADGALGSRTASLRQAYVDEPGSCGHPYLSATEVAGHLVECTEAGVQGGFHAIGDAAIAAVLAGFAVAATRVGVDRLRSARHRIEHVEIVDKALIGGLVEFGVVASMQPAFDRLWGGDAGMYAQRLGVQRSLQSNPIGAMAGVGVALAFGSDSPVTPVDPWGSVRAAMLHHNPVQRVGARTAFAAHTRGGWRAAREDDAGVLAPGAPATLAVWEPGPLVRGLPALLPEVADAAGGPLPALPRCRLTVLNGEAIFWR
jgi:predicted amidohydrolase YtcJ